MKGILGDDSSEDITLENGFSLKIEYKNKNISLNRTKYTGEYRVVQLYDENGKLLSELLEKNPHFNEYELRIKKYRHEHYGIPIHKREHFPSFNYYRRERRLRRSNLKRRLELIGYYKNRNPEDWERYVRWCKSLEKSTGKKRIY